MTRLDSSSREALVAYRIQRSKETYQDALRDFEAGSFNSSMNRLYYACFYGVLALLVKNGIETKSHEGVKRMFGLHFIATKIIENKSAFHKIFRVRGGIFLRDFRKLRKERSGLRD